MLGITYEPKKDLFAIMLQDLEHWIHRPETLYVDEGPKGVAALEIIDAAGVRHSLTISPTRSNSPRWPRTNGGADQADRLIVGWVSGRLDRPQVSDGRWQ